MKRRVNEISSYSLLVSAFFLLLCFREDVVGVSLYRRVSLYSPRSRLEPDCCVRSIYFLGASSVQNEF